MKNSILTLLQWIHFVRIKKNNYYIADDTNVHWSANVVKSKIGLLSGCNARCMIHGTLIGNYVSIGSNVRIGAGEHIYSNFTSHFFPYTVGEIKEDGSIFEDEDGNKYCNKIGHDVWIGDACFITRRVEIGNGAVIGAHSVVTKSVPPYSVVGGYLQSS